MNTAFLASEWWELALVGKGASVAAKRRGCKGFDVYRQWLYGANFATSDADKGDDELRCIRLIDAHVVGYFIQDSSFIQDVREESVKCGLKISNASRYNLLVRVYENTNGPCALRKCFIDLCLLVNRHTSSEYEEVPKDIRKDLRLRLRERTMACGKEEVFIFTSTAGYFEQDEAGIDKVDDTNGNESMDG
ncbi:hypothetical protein BKA58DRAFT_468997 [Alternaria rosae]|uniref:uncharacterized protein n=1 Tax=Alternaria rosae TaxID=1187941 RepID=UPI001E8D493A|nr:uncharacterized protein BKA58DRAFT_468997 [Alternaria rosae]KAH6873359.1 hypothetical protein BKA58DRAFT_468997 [Alternaria rosae]